MKAGDPIAILRILVTWRASLARRCGPWPGSSGSLRIAGGAPCRAPTRFTVHAGREPERGPSRQLAATASSRARLLDLGRLLGKRALRCEARHVPSSTRRSRRLELLDKLRRAATSWSSSMVLRRGRDDAPGRLRTSPATAGESLTRSRGKTDDAAVRALLGTSGPAARRLASFPTRIASRRGPRTSISSSARMRR